MCQGAPSPKALIVADGTPYNRRTREHRSFQDSRRRLSRPRLGCLSSTLRHHGRTASSESPRQALDCHNGRSEGDGQDDRERRGCRPPGCSFAMQRQGLRTASRESLRQKLGYRIARSAPDESHPLGQMVSLLSVLPRRRNGSMVNTTRDENLSIAWTRVIQLSQPTPSLSPSKR